VTRTLLVPQASRPPIPQTRRAACPVSKQARIVPVAADHHERPFRDPYQLDADAVSDLLWRLRLQMLCKGEEGNSAKSEVRLGLRSHLRGQDMAVPSSKEWSHFQFLKDYCLLNSRNGPLSFCIFQLFF